jgi:hypothetical protein
VLCEFLLSAKLPAMKQIKAAILTGGVLNLLLAIFHIVLCRMIYGAYHTADFYPLMQMLAVADALFIWFLALTSLVFREKLAMTSIGRSILLLNVVLYIVRVIGEFVLFPHPKPVIFIGCGLLAVLYTWIILAAAKLKPQN